MYCTYNILEAVHNTTYLSMQIDNTLDCKENVLGHFSRSYPGELGI